MEITLGQQCNVGENPTVILYTYINRHAGTPEKHEKQNRDNVFHSTLSNMVYYYRNGKTKPFYTTPIGGTLYYINAVLF